MNSLCTLYGNFKENKAELIWNLQLDPLKDQQKIREEKKKRKAGKFRDDKRIPFHGIFEDVPLQYLPYHQDGL